MITQLEIMTAASRLTTKIRAGMSGSVSIYGIPRGGVAAAYALAYFEIVDDPGDADILVDDLIDSGGTRSRYTALYPNKPFAALFTKREAEDIREKWLLYGTALPANEWVVFPWEGTAEASADDIVIRLLQYIGEDPNRPGLRETPARFLRAWKEWCAGYKQDPKEILKTFEDGADDVDEMVLVNNIPVASKCEHHLSDIFGLAHIAYIPNGRIVGLSKLSRLVDIFARRLQVQERLTVQIADALQSELNPLGVGVVLQCRHMCLESRGVKTRDSVTTTSAMRGALLTKPEARAEFLNLINGSRNGVAI